MKRLLFFLLALTAHFAQGQMILGPVSYHHDTASHGGGGGSARDTTYISTVAPDLSGDTMWVYGNSITAGYGLSDANNQRWTKLYADALGKVERNFGLNGRVMTNYPPCDHPVFDPTIVPPYHDRSGFVIISLGTNDVGLNNGHFEIPDFETSYNAALYEIIHNKGWPANKVILFCPYWIGNYGVWNGDCGATLQTDNSRLIDFVDRVKMIARNHGCVWVDWYQKMLDYGSPGSLLADGVHPNVTGHSWIAATAVNIIQ